MHSVMLNGNANQMEGVNIYASIKVALKWGSYSFITPDVPNSDRMLCIDSVLTLTTLSLL